MIEWIFQVTISENKALENIGRAIVFLGVHVKHHPIKGNPQLSCLKSFYVGQTFSTKPPRLVCLYFTDEQEG